MQAETLEKRGRESHPYRPHALVASVVRHGRRSRIESNGNTAEGARSREERGEGEEEGAGGGVITRVVGAPRVAGDALGELVDRRRGHRGRRRRGAARRGCGGGGGGGW